MMLAVVCQWRKGWFPPTDLSETITSAYEETVWAKRLFLLRMSSDVMSSNMEIRRKHYDLTGTYQIVFLVSQY